MPGREINLWDAQTGTVRATIRGHAGANKCVAFSPDGQILAAASSDGTILLYDLHIGR